MPTTSIQQASTSLRDEACHRVPVVRTAGFLERLFFRVRSWLVPAPYRLDVTGPARCHSKDGAGPVLRSSQSGAGWRSSRPNRPTRKSAFTLIELIVVVIILGIAAAIVLPRMSAGADFQATSAARMVAVDIEYAQNYAITTQRKIAVEFQTAVADASGKLLTRGAYRLVDSDAGTPINHPIHKSPYVVSFTNMRDFTALQIDIATFGSGSTASSSVAFDTIGAPDQGGIVLLSAGAFEYTIGVAPVTGKVRVMSGPPIIVPGGG